MEQLFVLLQHLAPQHLLSRLVGCFADTKIPWLKTQIIKRFATHYRVDMQEAQVSDLSQFDSFNDFFTRALRNEARPFDKSDANIISPADGFISQTGNIRHGRMIQAKNHDFELLPLLGGDFELFDQFDGGRFATVYLSPRDYHRVHMPYAGTLQQMIYIPGKLFSVNDATTRHVANLFAKNERLVCHFETTAGPMAVIFVGAMIVAGIETVWAGKIAPHGNQILSTRYDQQEKKPTFNTGDELGRFRLGSTAIVLFGNNQVRWQENLQPGSSIRMGHSIGCI